MILHHLRLRNFKQYSELDLSFREGLVGITGKNGSGKSTIFHAIIICLFGRKSKDNVEAFRTRNISHKEAVELELQFEVTGKRYRIVREFRGKTNTHKANLYQNESDLIATGATPVSEEAAKLIGMDRESFMRSVFSGQKELDEISKAGPEARRKMIREMIGLEKLDLIQKKIREDGRGIANQIKGKASDLLDEDATKELEKQHKESEVELKKAEVALTEKVKVNEKNEAEYKKAKAEFERLHEIFIRFQQIQVKQKQLQERLVLSQKQFEERTKELQQMEVVQKELEADLTRATEYEQLLDEQKKMIAANQAAERKRGFEKDLKRIEEEGKTLAADLESLQEGLKEEAEFAKKKKELEATLVREKEMMSEIDSAISKLQKISGEFEGRIKDRKIRIGNIKEIGRDADCPTCLRPLHDSYDSTIEKLTKEIEEIEKKEIAKIGEQIREQESLQKSGKERIESSLQREKEMLSELKVIEERKRLVAEQEKRVTQKRQEYLSVKKQLDELGEVDFDATRFTEVNEKVKSDESFYSLYQQKKGQVKELESVQAKVAEAKESIKTSELEIKESALQMKELEFSEKDYSDSRSVLSKTEEVRDNSLREVAELKDRKSGLELLVQKFADKLKQQADLAKSIEGLQEKGEDLELLDKLFDRFKADILERVREPISRTASELFRQITSDRYDQIMVDGDFMFHIWDDGEYYPIADFSGGETDLANLCLRIAISRAIAELSGKTEVANFLGFDEIFGSQDEERRAGILKALEYLKEQYRQIYIITHIDGVKDSFPQILEVRRAAAGSQASWLS